MAIIISYGHETARVAASSSLVSNKRTCSLVNDNEASYRSDVKQPGWLRIAAQ